MRTRGQSDRRTKEQTGPWIDSLSLHIVGTPCHEIDRPIEDDARTEGTEVLDRTYRWRFLGVDQDAPAVERFAAGGDAGGVNACRLLPDREIVRTTRCHHRAGLAIARRRNRQYRRTGGTVRTDKRGMDRPARSFR